MSFRGQAIGSPAGRVARVGLRTPTVGHFMWNAGPKGEQRMNDSIRTRGSRFAGWAACVGLVTLATVPVYAQPAGITPQERAILDIMSPLPDLPPDPTNRYADNPAAAL